MISVRTKLYFSMENLILQQFFVFTFSERHDKMCSYLYFSFLRGQTMDSNFFALISRMRYIARWGLMRNALPENIQEHSHMVAVLGARARRHPARHFPPAVRRQRARNCGAVSRCVGDPHGRPADADQVSQRGDHVGLPRGGGSGRAEAARHAAAGAARDLCRCARRG